jgi:NAD(P)-dependent dehydrogenase (short-subunit alcohol dehydrogenase family)
VQLDVADAEAVVRGATEIAAALGPIDVLVNNAGIVNNIARIADMKPEAWEHELRVNLSGAFHTVRAIAPAMAARGWGRVINIASVAALKPSTGQPAYSASKAGVVAFTQSVAQEFGRGGVTANAVLPGLIGTPLVLSMPEAIRARSIAQIRSRGSARPPTSARSSRSSPAAGHHRTAIPCDGGLLGAALGGLDG